MHYLRADTIPKVLVTEKITLAMNSKRTYIEWLSGEELHQESLVWASELKFARDEQRFLNDLIKENTLDLVDAKIFDQVKPVVSSLDKLEKEVNPLLKQIQLHENQLRIMVDDVDQLKMETAYLETHADLANQLDGYFRDYKIAKSEIFKIISEIIKKRRQKRLLN